MPFTQPPAPLHTCGVQVREIGTDVEQVSVQLHADHPVHVVGSQVVPAPGFVQTPSDWQVSGLQSVSPVTQPLSFAGFTEQPPAPSQRLQTPQLVALVGFPLHAPRLAQVFGLHVDPSPHSLSVLGFMLQRPPPLHTLHVPHFVPALASGVHIPSDAQVFGLHGVPSPQSLSVAGVALQAP